MVFARHHHRLVGGELRDRGPVDRDRVGISGFNRQLLAVNADDRARQTVAVLQGDSGGIQRRTAATKREQQYEVLRHCKRPPTRMYGWRETARAKTVTAPHHIRLGIPHDSPETLVGILPPEDPR